MPALWIVGQVKVDKRNPEHWIKLALFAMYVIVALGFRVFRRTRPRLQIVLYGHKLSGNLLAIHRKLCLPEQPKFDVAFVTMDEAYHNELSAAGITSVLATTPALIGLLSRTDAVISDHGLHAMFPLLWLASIKFFDVWHGIPFKGFDAEDFRTQQRYDETWVASPLLAKMYVDRYGFAPEKVRATGYARTDRLVQQDENVAEIRLRLGLAESAGKIVLFAPTWKQDASQRSIYPFGTDERSFFSALSAMASRAGATVVVRAHLNSGATNGEVWPGIVHRPFASYPDTEELLLASDILVCDWSSIAFDYLLLDRPTIFLDVDAPFAKGFSLDSSFRFGAIATGMDSMIDFLDTFLANPERYQQEFGAAAQQIRRVVYGGFDDGEATVRCIERLQHHLDTSEVT